MEKLFSKSTIAFFILLFINFIFIMKYAERYSKYAWIVAIIVLLIQLILLKRNEFLAKFAKYLNYFNISLLICFTLVCSYLFIKIPVLSLMVDRATVISSFWDNFFNNEYAYFAHSHRGNPPGPMPFYYILALPFYLIGELGYFSILGIIAFYLILKFTKVPVHLRTVALLLIFSSFFYLWEVICRSNLILNGSLVLAALIFFLSKDKKNSKFLLLTGIITGLVLSTRNVYAIPFIILYLFALKSKRITFLQCMAIGLISLCIFAVTFVPFVLGHWNDFLTMNPFIVQSDYLMPFSHTLVFIVLAIITPLFVKRKEEVYFYSGIVLFLTIVWYHIYHIVNQGFYVAFYESWADISYFILCVPFLLYYIIIVNKTYPISKGQQ